MSGNPEGDTWTGLFHTQLPVDRAVSWAVLPGCGGLVSFLGTVRDHAEDRPGVTSLEYEAYTEQVDPRLHAIAGEARAKWPELGRVAMLHRVGELGVTEVSVVVVVSAPHRAEAFEAARFCIDALKTSVPIWKRETWSGGAGWSVCASDLPDGHLSEGAGR